MSLLGGGTSCVIAKGEGPVVSLLGGTSCVSAKGRDLLYQC